MTSSDQSSQLKQVSPQIVRARTKSEILSGFALLMHHADQSSLSADLERISEKIDSGEMDVENLWIAKSSEGEEQKCIGVLYLILQSDQTGLLWPPVTASENDNAELTTKLLQTALKTARDRNCTYLQCLLQEHDDDVAAFLKCFGFEELGPLLFMQVPQLQHLAQPASSPGQSFSIQPYQNLLSDRELEEILERTYEQSSDFPEMEHSRSGAQSIQTHRLQGEYNPQHWYVFLDQQLPVGVIFWAWHADLYQWELAYVGLVPEARRKGLGKRLVHSSAHQLQRSGAAAFLGVDSRNEYAVRFYDSLGFSVVSRQRLLIGWPERR